MGKLKAPNRANSWITLMEAVIVYNFPSSYQTSKIREPPPWWWCLSPNVWEGGDWDLWRRDRKGMATSTTNITLFKLIRIFMTALQMITFQSDLQFWNNSSHACFSLWICIAHFGWWKWDFLCIWYFMHSRKIHFVMNHIRKMGKYFFKGKSSKMRMKVGRKRKKKVKVDIWDFMHQETFLWDVLRPIIIYEPDVRLSIKEG